MDGIAHIAVLWLDISIPASQSLKTKRRVLKSVKDRIRSRFNAAVAEVGELDKWQRSLCGVTMLGNDKRFLEQSMASVSQLVLSYSEIIVLDSRLEFL